jgi:hypothetical protein
LWVFLRFLFAAGDGFRTLTDSTPRPEQRPSSDDPSTINQHAENLLKLSGGPASGNEYDDSPPDSPEHKPKKKRNKKRARPDSDVPDVSRVTLSREDILRISSKELEEFAARMAAEKALSPEEQREIKRQRRLIKNREYAQASRVKKKAYMGDMESRFHEFEQENYELKLQLAQANQRISELQADNTILRSKLSSSSTRFNLLILLMRAHSFMADASVL